MFNFGYAIWLQAYYQVSLEIKERIKGPAFTREEYLDHHNSDYGAFQTWML